MCGSGCCGCVIIHEPTRHAKKQIAEVLSVHGLVPEARDMPNHSLMYPIYIMQQRRHQGCTLQQTDKAVSVCYGTTSAST